MGNFIFGSGKEPTTTGKDSEGKENAADEKSKESKGCAAESTMATGIFDCASGMDPYEHIEYKKKLALSNGVSNQGSGVLVEGNNNSIVNVHVAQKCHHGSTFIDGGRMTCVLCGAFKPISKTTGDKGNKVYAKCRFCPMTIYPEPRFLDHVCGEKTVSE